MVKTENADIKTFTNQLAAYKKLIDSDIAEYSKQVSARTVSDYGPYSRVATDAYLEILARGGKRIRGSLVIHGYKMSGGKDIDMILQAARAIEMIHAYILIIDDITDRSDVRRGGPTAHILLSEYYAKNGFGNDTKHFGESIAMTAALLGSHAAQMTMANLDADQQLRLNALSILNRGILVTIHGQFNDIFNQVVDDVTEEKVNNVTSWKTAHYTFLNPLHIGMILASAGCQATDAITEYAMEVGSAFQITDDILGTFGSEFEVGKSPLDDIQEGKRTLLILYALHNTSSDSRDFLIKMLGKQDLTKSEFHRCQTIIEDSGALEYARKKAKKHIDKAVKSLIKESDHWESDGVRFLSGLAYSLLKRNS